jgi:hypothetical protein
MTQVSDEHHDASIAVVDVGSVRVTGPARVQAIVAEDSVLI